MFAVNHSKKHGDGSGILDFKDYALGFETYSGEQLSNFYLPSKKGLVQVRNLSIWFTNSNTLHLVNVLQLMMFYIIFS